MKEIGVEMSLYFSDKETSRAYVITDKKKNQITYFYWGASEDFERMKPVKREFVHLATGSPIYNRKVAELSEFVSFDPGQDIVNYDSESLWGVLSNSDMLICNRFEITKIFSMLDMDMNELLETLEFVIVTCDAGGSVVHTNEGSHHIKAVDVDVVDPTGAGDGYRAGLFVGMQKGYDIVTSAKIGSVVASFVIESEGAQTNLPDWKRALNRYKKEFGEIPQKS
ncbi:carbohydrate kinase family protein [Methanosarcinales archaeon]|nr:MAG: carbohydrate kinase family protein [Methanosarcinales archaeon]